MVQSTSVARLAVSLLAIALLCDAAIGGVISRDWKSPGDGLLTYDDVNRREWLDLSQTILSSQFPGLVSSPHFTRENRYQYVTSQTGAGGLFAGFLAANRADVELLALSAGINTALLGPANLVPAETLAQHIGITYEANNGFRVSVGLLDEPLQNQSGTLIRPGVELYVAASQAGIAVSPGHFQYPASPGVMLYRAVPEPSTIALAACALALFAPRRRR